MVPEGFVDLRAWLIERTQLSDIILGFQNGNQITRPYGVLHLTSDGAIGETPVARTIRDTSDTPLVEWAWEWQFDVIGDGAGNYVEPIRRGRQVSQIHAQLLPWRIHRIGGTTHLREPIDNEFEDRISVPIVLHGLRSDGLPIDTAIEAPITLTRQY